MLEIIIIALGKVKQDTAYIKPGLAEYERRLSAFAKLRWLELADEKISPTRTEDQVKIAEGERILQTVDTLTERHSGALMIGLSERGETVSSVELVKVLFGLDVAGDGTNQPNGGMPQGVSNPIIIIIGGALGLSSQVLQRCHRVMSLSRLTFPHQMVRLILVEQVYRAFKILRNEPYHK